jgi:hypothetical protein
MKRAIIMAAALCVLCGFAALGAVTARGSSPVEVSLPGCYFAGGGQATVPAGSDVTVRIGWSGTNRGRVQNFLNAQATTADLNGTPIANASALWGPVEYSVAYFSYWRARAGTLANPGDSVTVHMQVNLARIVEVGKDPDSGVNFKAGSGPVLPADFGCTITAT